jgi:hypothetical protein
LGFGAAASRTALLRSAASAFITFPSGVTVSLATVPACVRSSAVFTVFVVA